jgi:hypothetical protein
MKKFYSFFSLLLMAPLAWSQTCVGPNSGSTGTNEAVTGSTTTWSSLTNGGASDNAYVISGSLPTNTNYTDRFVITGFGFSLPSNAVVTGVEVRVEKSVTGSSNISDREIMLVKGGVTQTAHNKAITVTAWSTTDAVITYGNSIDLWNNSWTYSDINDPGFGVAIMAQRFLASGPPQQARIDHVTVTVCYSLLAPLQINGFQGWINNQKQVSLRWYGQNEDHVQHYEVEASANGRQFFNRAIIEKGNTGTYNWTAECSEYHYFRVKQKDKDGNSFVTNTLRLSCEQKALLLSQNGNKALLGGVQNDAPLLLTVYNATGQQLVQKKWPVVRSGEMLEYDLSSLNHTGNYYLVLTQGNLKTSKVFSAGR